MSSYNGRRGPNVSQYVANLNTIPSAQDLVPEPINFEEDLALFTNEDFIDWDALDTATSVDFNAETEHRNRRTNAGGDKHYSTANQGEAKAMDFMSSDFQFADFTAGFPNPIVDQSLQNLPHGQANSFVPPTYTSPVSASVSPVTPQFEQSTGKKRKLENVSPPSQQAIDEAARVAAEEDKRRRNTAASARFRVKKKQREQALEKTAKEMTEKVNVLESRISQLETENTWLKGLLMEKNTAKDGKGDSSSKAIEDNAGERSTSGRTDGVGTGAKIEKAKA